MSEEDSSTAEPNNQTVLASSIELCHSALTARHCVSVRKVTTPIDKTGSMWVGDWSREDRHPEHSDQISPPQFSNQKHPPERTTEAVPLKYALFPT